MPPLAELYLGIQLWRKLKRLQDGKVREYTASLKISSGIDRVKSVPTGKADFRSEAVDRMAGCCRPRWCIPCKTKNPHKIISEFCSHKVTKHRRQFHYPTQRIVHPHIFVFQWHKFAYWLRYECHQRWGNPFAWRDSSKEICVKQSWQHLFHIVNNWNHLSQHS